MRHQRIEPILMTRPVSAIDLIRHFRGVRVLVIGDAMLDTYLEGNATRLCSEGPIPVVSKTAEYRLPGGAANTAANLHALEADVAFLSIVGNDNTCSLLRETLHTYGVSDQWLIEDASVQTLHKLRIVADGQYVARFDEGGTREKRAPVSEACTQRLLASLETLYRWCDLVIISDYGYGVASERLIARFNTLHAAQSKVVLIDSKSLQRFRDVQATIVTPNFVETRALIERMTGVSYDTPQQEQNCDAVEELGRQVLNLLKAEYVAITLGNQGVCLFGRQYETRHLPAHPVARANDVGAGDSFIAAMALALAAGAGVEEAALIGIDAAAIAVTRQRTAVVCYQELLQRVSLREYAKSASMSCLLAGEEDTQAGISRLVSRLNNDQSAGRTVVFTNGIFDILHAGHVQFLRQAKALGDILVVGINTDRSAQRLKGRWRPINGERDRMALVAALDMVDHVVLFDEDTPTELIRILRPDIHVKGGDYADEALPEAEAVHDVGGKLVILPLAGSLSTGRKIERIVEVVSEHADEYVLDEQIASLSNYGGYHADNHNQQGGAI